MSRKMLLPYYGGVGLVICLSLPGHGESVSQASKLFTPPPAAEGLLTLRDCYNLAHQQNENLRIKKEDIQKAAARQREAVGSVLPEIRWTYNTAWQDTSGQSNSSNNTSASLKDRYSQSRFTADQTVFHGMREYSAIKGAAADTRRLGYEYTRSEVDLVEQVSLAFYNVILKETDNTNFEAIVSLSQNRIKDLRSRARIGRSRESEVLSAESQLANLEAQWARLKGDIITSRERLGYLLGRDATNTTLTDEMGLPMLLSEEEAIKLAGERSDLKALEEDLLVKKYLVQISRSGYLPNLDLSGNYYTQRVGIQSNIDWDVLLALDVPLFQGGQVKAQVEQALADWKATRVKRDQLERIIRSDVKIALASLKATREEALILDGAHQKAKRSYELQDKEYRLGLVQNLDVLAALNTMLAAKQEWDRATIQSKLEYIHLSAITENFAELIK